MNPTTQFLLEKHRASLSKESAESRYSYIRKGNHSDACFRAHLRHFGNCVGRLIRSLSKWLSETGHKNKPQSNGNSGISVRGLR